MKYKIVSIPLRYGTTRYLVTLLKSKCQFLLGTVQLSDTTKGAKFLGIVSIPLRYGTTFTEISSRFIN